MNRSSKGFGLASVLGTVIVLIIFAIFSASARSSILITDSFPHVDNISSKVDVLK
jgi:hypothetical protein